MRGRFPRFNADNAAHNLEFVRRLQAFAAQRGVAVAQLAIAWVASRGDDVIPLIGARRVDQLEQALDGLELKLDAAELSELEDLVPAAAAAGSRYGEAQMAELDSERG